MADLTIGGFRKNPVDVQQEDIDLSVKNEGVPEGSDPIEKIEDNVPTNTPENISNEQGSPEGQPAPLDTNTDPVEEQEPVKQPLEIDDQSALKYLSEKLGKPLESFDDLTKTEVVNPLDDDPYLKELVEWRKKTGRPIQDWIKFQKDYKTVPDLDVAREFLQHEYPDFTEDEINLELKKFISSEDDLDDEIALKKLELKKYATKGRETLSKFVSELGEPSEKMNFSKEIQEDLTLAKQVKEDYEISKKLQDDYNKGITNASEKTQSFKMNLTNEMSLDFRIPDKSRKDIPEMINTMPHWKNEDGSWNHEAVVGDAIKIKHFDEMIKLAYEQGVNTGKEAIIADTKNVNLELPSNSGQNDNNGKGVVIEGLEQYLGGQGMKIRTRK